MNHLDASMNTITLPNEVTRHSLKLNLHCVPGFSLLFLVSSLLFLCLPQIDIWTSQLFYQEGAYFPANDLCIVKLIYEGTPWLGRLMFLGAICVVLIAVCSPSIMSRRHWRRAAALIAVILLGVGLLVHTILKDGMGRPRPRDLQIFAGVTTYVPVFTPSQYCASNCSFVSGHAAVGVSLMSFGMLAVRRRRQFWLLTGLISGCVIGVVRIAQGGHFLSDIVYSFLAIWMSHLIVRSIWLRFRSRQLYKPQKLVSRLT